ncbi:hypothetical protein PDE01_26310 [Paracoccus denitrificans]|nr:hypothetical protein PDE01_26310 [Paracoccus denitrificans]
MQTAMLAPQKLNAINIRCVLHSKRRHGPPARNQCFWDAGAVPHGKPDPGAFLRHSLPHPPAISAGNPARQVRLQSVG